MSEILLKTKAVERLKGSKVFQKQELYIQILVYLIASEKEGVVAKSSTIALELLGSQNGMNTSIKDSQIRMKIQKLRKELELFYLTEGKDEQYKLYIPKGEYALKLREEGKQVVESTVVFSSNKKLRVFIFSLLLVILLLIVTIGYLLLGRDFASEPVKKTSLVSSLLTDDELHIVLGSRGFYSEYDAGLGRKRFIFDEDIELPRSIYKMKVINNRFPDRNASNAEEKFRHVDIENMLLGNKIAVEWTLKGIGYSVLESTTIDQVQKITQNTVVISKMRSGDLYGLVSFFAKTRLVFKEGYQNVPTKLTHYIAKDSSHVPLYVSAMHDAPQYFLIKKVKTINEKSVLFLLPSSNRSRDYVFSRIYNEKFIQDILSYLEKKGSNADEFELLLEIDKQSSHRLVYLQTPNTLRFSY